MKQETITIGNFFEIANEFGWGCAIRYVWHNAKKHETFLDHLNHDIIGLGTCSEKTPTVEIASKIKFCSRASDNKPYLTSEAFVAFWNSGAAVRIIFGHSDQRTLEPHVLHSIVKHEIKQIIRG